MTLIGLGCFFLLILGPMLAIPSLMRWEFRRRTYRLRMLASMIGESAAHWLYVLLGAGLAFLGVYFIAAGVWQTKGAKAALRNQGGPDVVATNRLATHAGPLDVREGRRPLKGIPRPVAEVAEQVAFSPDGARLLVASDKLVIQDPITGGRHGEYDWWKLGVREKLPELDRDSARVAHLATSHDGRFVMLTIRSGVRILPWVGRWTWDSPERIDLLPLPPDAGDRVAISADGRYGLVYFGARRASPAEPAEAVRIDFAQGQVEPLGLSGDFAGVDFLGTSFHVAVALAKAVRIVVFDVGENREVRAAEHSSDRPGRPMTTASFHVAADGTWGVTCHASAGDHKARVWDLNRVAVLSETRFDENLRVKDCAIAPEGRKFVTIGATDEAIVVWNRSLPTATPRREATYYVSPAASRSRSSAIETVLFSPDGDLIVAVKKNEFLVWETRGE